MNLVYELPLAVFFTMSINKSLHMDPHASRLVGPVTLIFLFSLTLSNYLVLTCNISSQDFNKNLLNNMIFIYF